MSERNDGLPNTNDVLAQKLLYLEREVKKNTRDIEVIERDIVTIHRFTDSISSSQDYMKETMKDIKESISQFINIVQDQNEKIDKGISEQNKKIDEFVNSDKRRTAKKDFAVSVIQAVGTILLTIVTLWITGTL